MTSDSILELAARLRGWAAAPASPLREPDRADLRAACLLLTELAAIKAEAARQPTGGYFSSPGGQVPPEADRPEYDTPEVAE